MTIEPIRISLHSVTDLITNSSTTIYTYSENSEETCRKMVDAILKAVGSKKTCDEMFALMVSVDEDSIVSAADAVDEDDDPLDMPVELIKGTHDERRKYARKLLDDVALGTVKQPDWLKKIANKDNYNGYREQTYLTLTPKKPEYAAAARAVREFLYSTDHEASTDG
jgi:hypothetical protein